MQSLNIWQCSPKDECEMAHCKSIRVLKICPKFQVPTSHFSEVNDLVDVYGQKKVWRENIQHHFEFMSLSNLVICFNQILTVENSKNENLAHTKSAQPELILASLDETMHKQAR